jgi:hypothetical protein
MHLAMKKRNLKMRRKYTGTCVDDKSISALCAETSKTMQQCYDFAGRHKGTIIRIQQALNSTGSMVGIEWVTDCWGVVRVGNADGGDSFPSDIHACLTAHHHIQNKGS